MQMQRTAGYMVAVPVRVTVCECGNFRVARSIRMARIELNLGGESASSGSKIEHVAGCSRGLSDFQMSVVFCRFVQGGKRFCMMRVERHRALWLSFCVIWVKDFGSCPN